MFNQSLKRYQADDGVALAIGATLRNIYAVLAVSANCPNSRSVNFREEALLALLLTLL